mgnify:CR=1 FL=1
MQPLPRLILATRNAHKTAEIRAMVGDRFEVLDATAFPDFPEIEETGTTFLENARLKAEGISRCVEGWVLSDDSGLEVDALEGAPGVGKTEADRLRQHYWDAYGTTLAGLMREHDIDPAPYLTDVHDIDFSVLPR